MDTVSVTGTRFGRTRATPRLRGPRAVGLMAAALLVGSSLSGCSDHVGAGAVVGSVSIPESRIQSLASTVLTEGGADGGTAVAITVTRTVATNAIRHQLILQAAAAHGVTVKEADINAALAQVPAGTGASLGVPSADLADYLRDYLLLQGLMTKLGAAAEVQDVDLKIDYLFVTGRDAAVAAQAKYATDPAALTAAIAQAPAGADGAKTGGTDQPVTLLQQPSLASTGLFAAQPGEVVVVPANTGQFLVARVTARVQQTAALTATVLAALPPNSGPAGQVGLMSLLLAPYATKDGVSVNPRFGAWDPLTVQVVPGSTGV